MGAGEEGVGTGQVERGEEGWGGGGRGWVFFFEDTATAKVDTLALHGALPIWSDGGRQYGG